MRYAGFNEVKLMITIFLGVKKEAASFSETYVNIYQTTWRHISEDSNP
jgi:hypothetical protein